MKTSTFINEEKLVSEAINTLIKKFGPVETSRFLSLSKAKRTDSVKRHHLWQTKLDKKDFFDTVFK